MRRLLKRILLLHLPWNQEYVKNPVGCEEDVDSAEKEDKRNSFAATTTLENPLISIRFAHYTITLNGSLIVFHGHKESGY